MLTTKEKPSFLLSNIFCPICGTISLRAYSLSRKVTCDNCHVSFRSLLELQSVLELRKSGPVIKNHKGFSLCKTKTPGNNSFAPNAATQIQSS